MPSFWNNNVQMYQISSNLLTAIMLYCTPYVAIKVHDITLYFKPAAHEISLLS
jgi:hypothetical protein